MRILVVASQPLRASLGTATRIENFVSGFSAAGREVVVLDPFSRGISRDANFLRTPDPFAKGSRFLGMLTRQAKKVYYRRSTSAVLLNRPVLSLLISIIRHNVERVLRQHTFDIIQAEQEPAVLACSDALRRLSSSTPLVADLHSLWTNELLEWGVLSSKAEFSMLRQLTERAINAANLTLVVSDEMKDELLRSFPWLKSRSSSIFSFVSTTNPAVIVPHYIERPHRVAYSGSTLQLGFDNLLNAMKIVLREIPSASLDITGPVSEGRRARRFLQDFGISGSFSWFESRTCLSTFLAHCHLGVIPTYDKSRRFAYPTKLFEYLAAGLPIVAADIGGWTRIITKMNVGIVVRPTTLDLARGIITLLRDPEKRYQFSKNALELLSTQFNANNQMRTLLQRYDQLQRPPISTFQNVALHRQ